MNESNLKIICANCKKPKELINTERCPDGKHIGNYHQSFGDCEFLKCGWGLGPLKIGHKHWDCCYSTKYMSKCEKAKHDYIYVE